MGTRGPRPTPKNILKSRGSWRGKGKPTDPEVDASPPPPPDYLEPEARALWDELVPELQRMGVLAKLDRTVLIRYCQQWARWRMADKFISEHGMTYELLDEKGGVRCSQQVPQVAIANRLSTQLLQIEREFGLTPSARSRVEVKAEKRIKRRPPEPGTAQMKIAT